MMAIARPSHIPYIPDHLLGKLAPPLIFLGGAYGTAAVGAAVGAALASGQVPHIQPMGGHGGLFINDQDSQYVVAPVNHQI